MAFQRFRTRRDDRARRHQQERRCRFLVEDLEGRQMLSTFTVTSTADSGTGSLRQAIISSNGTTGPNTIVFKINSTGVQTINVLSPLPTITMPVTIDGTTQTSYGGTPLVALDGASAGTSAVGLSLASTAAGSTLKGLAIDSFAAGGVLINGGSNDVVSADHIGVTPAGTGTSNSGNGSFGVEIEGGATGATVAGDVISNNHNYGVEVAGSGTSSNVIASDYIGTDASGLVAVPNLVAGVYIGVGASGNIVGGVTAGTADVISGNTDYGVEIAGSSGNVVAGDFIGTAVGGGARLANGSGVYLTGGASKNTIGGLSATARDVISANLNQGVSIVNSSSNLVEGDYIGVGANGMQALGNAQGVLVQNTAGTQVTTGNTIGGTSSLARDVISANLGQGVSISAAAGTVVDGDYIGLNAAGNAPVNANDSHIQVTGVLVGTNSSGTTIGGTVAGAGDVITGNVDDGVDVGNAMNTLIAGDDIGTDPSGTLTSAESQADLNNFADGVMLSGVQGVTIGGTIAAARDVISNNYDNGVVIAGSTGVVVQGDFIGTDVSGENGLLGNGNTGVLVTQGSSKVTIGSAGAGDVISDSGNGGIIVSGASSVLIAGDKIGTDLTGEHSVGNDNAGVSVAMAPGTTIGGTTAAARNVISGNSGPGITITSSPGSLVEGNYIGIDAAGAVPLGNSGDGVFIDQSANVTIGGTAAADRNIISANTGSGVELDAASNNMVEGNFIGTDSTGTTAGSGTNSLGNELYGVFIHAASTGDTIAGSTAAPTVISGNLNIGVLITDSGTMGNLVEGTEIGTNIAGNAALPNQSHGLVITNGATGNTIGGTTAAARDVISGNLNNGVAFSGASTTGNVVEGDYIGTNAAGTAGLGNHANGVFFSAAPGNTVGGTTAGARNIISGNASAGIWITSGASNEKIQGNYIGTDVTGLHAVANNTGVWINGASPYNVIGGTISADRNVISGNAVDGVLISDSGTNYNLVESNYIGTGSTGTTAVANGNAGVVVEYGASNNLVQANVISANLNYGVLVTASGTENNTVNANLIGTDAAGTALLLFPGWDFSNDVGVAISNGAYATSVGTNVIAGNWIGVEIDGSATNNWVVSNHIGTDVSNTLNLGNIDNGVYLSETSGNEVGYDAIYGGVYGIDTYYADQNSLVGNWFSRNLDGTETSYG